MNLERIIRNGVAMHYMTFHFDQRKNISGSSDKCLLNELQEQNSAYNAELMIKVSTIFGVIRNVRRDGDRELVTSHLNQIVDGTWSEKKLSEKAAACNSAIAPLKPEHTEGEIMSLATKLAWFVSPKGWTLYDNLAANALGAMAGTGRKKRTRWEHFYQILEQRRFIDCASAIDLTIAESSAPELFGERVIDKCLWLMGNVWVDAEREMDRLEHQISREPFNDDIKNLQSAILSNNLADDQHVLTGAR